MERLVNGKTNKKQNIMKKSFGDPLFWIIDFVGFIIFALAVAGLVAILGGSHLLTWDTFFCFTCGWWATTIFLRWKDTR